MSSVFFGITRRFTRPPLLAALLAASVTAAHAQAQTPVFTPIGDIPGGQSSPMVSAVSADGSLVAGQGVGNGTGFYQASLWTSATGMIGLGYLPGFTFQSYAAAVSADGSVVAGSSTKPFGTDYRAQAFRWTAAGGMVALGYLPRDPRVNFTTSYAYGVSSDGSVVVGQSHGVGGYQAFRWTEATGMVGLGDLPGEAFKSDALGVSGDGAVVVGKSVSATTTGFDAHEAFRWTEATGMVGLGFLPQEAFANSNSFASGASGDGAVIVGASNSFNSSLEAFRWTTATGMVGLGDLPGGDFYSAARGVSANGAVVVGVGADAEGLQATLWTAATGMVSLKQYLLDNYGALLPSDFAGWALREATGVSADGSVIVGNGRDPNGQVQAWRIKFPPKWTPIDVAVNRTDNTSRLLWRQSNGRYAVWKLSATGAVQTGKYYGPIIGYSCDQIAVGPNGETTLLWKNPVAGRTALWTLAGDLSIIVKATVYNNPAGYAPQNIAVDENNNVRMTLRRTNGQVVFWTITPATGAITSASGLYGPYANLQDGPIAVGPDGRIRLLWRDITTNRPYLWTLPATYGARSSGYTFEPLVDATASDIAVGMDNKTRLLWAHPDGKIVLWKVDTSQGGTGAIEAQKAYGPYAGVSPLGLSVGGDNQTRQLWRYSSGPAVGKAALWTLNDPLTSITAGYTYGPIH